MIQDTVEARAMVSDEEIAWALTEYSDTKFASAFLLRVLSVKYGKAGSVRVGDLSVSNADVEKWQGLANIYDPLGVTTGSSMVLPIFGGQSIADKDTLAEDTDVPQPWFTRDGDDISGGPDGTDTDYDG